MYSIACKTSQFCQTIVTHDIKGLVRTSYLTFHLAKCVLIKPHTYCRVIVLSSWSFMKGISTLNTLTTIPTFTLNQHKEKKSLFDVILNLQEYVV